MLPNSTLIFLLLSLILSTEITAQVIIKEKVEVNPQSSPSQQVTTSYNLYMVIAPLRSLYNDPIRPGELVDINFSVCHYVIGLPFNGAVCEDLPSNQYFNATVSWEHFVGEDEDNIPYLVSGNIESDTLNNVMNGFKFKAPEYMNIGGLQVKVTVSTIYNGSTIMAEDYITIEPDTSLIVKYNPASIAPGDTTELILQKVLYGGSIVNYNPLQSFEVGMLEGCLLGKIHAGEIDSNYIYGATQPIYFIADSSADSGVVKLKVGLIIKDWEIAPKILNNTNQTTETKLENSVNEYCFIGNFKSVIFGEGNLLVWKKYDLEILEPTASSEEWITPEPNMPQVTCKARLKNYDKGTVKFRWEYWVSNEFRRRNINSSGQYYDLCSRIGKTEFLGWSYSQNSEVTNWQVPFLKDSGYYHYQAIWYKNKPESHPAYGCENFTTEYEGGNEVFTGGNVWVKVTAYDIQGKKLAEDTLNAGKLLGNNQPDPTIIYSYASSNEIIAIIKHESRTYQFDENGTNWPHKEKGWPLYGYPNGYGLMQLDSGPAPVEEQLWNWKSNIEGGKSRFNVSKKVAQEYINREGATFEEDKFYMNAYQNYNSGSYRYWDWVGGEIGWIESKNKGPRNPEYGRRVYTIFKQLN